jgi:hypothetical protein
LVSSARRLAGRLLSGGVPGAGLSGLAIREGEGEAKP